VGDADELLHGAARDPRGTWADGRPGRRGDRQRGVGQRLLPAARRHRRLRSGQGGAGQPHQVAGAGERAKGIRVNAVSPGPVASDLWLGRDGVAETVAAATGVDADTARETIVAGLIKTT
jgi:hypothetical protein